MNATIKQKWTSSLVHLIQTMSDADLTHRFVHATFSDKAILPIQWAQKVMEKAMLKPDMTLYFHQWLDDLLEAPLQFEIVWIIPERIFTENINSLFQYGQLYCFNKHTEQNAENLLWKHLHRPLVSLDGYTLCLLSEIVKRQKKKLTIERFNVTQIHMTLAIDLPVPPKSQTPTQIQEFLSSLMKPPLTQEEARKKEEEEEARKKEKEKNKTKEQKEAEEEAKRLVALQEKIQASRNQLFLHLILSFLALPFLASHIPDRALNMEGFSIDTFNIMYWTTIVHQLLLYFHKKCNRLDAYRYPDWFRSLNLLLSRLHLRKRQDLHTLFGLLNCSCVCCTSLQPILLKYIPIRHDLETQDIDMSTILLQLYRASLPNQSEETTEQTQEIIQLNSLFADSMGTRMFIQFSKDMTLKQESARRKRDREEELEPWRKNYRLMKEEEEREKKKAKH